MISKFTSAVSTSVASALLIFVMQTAKAQVVKTEGFDNAFAGTTWPNTEVPFGWTTGKTATSVDPNNYWERVGAGGGATNPTPVPATQSGAGAMKFRSNFIVAAGDVGFLVSRPYDLTARGAVSSTVSFYLYRDNAYTGNDQIQVYVNNTPTAVGGTLLTETPGGATTIARNCLGIPPAICNTWVQYTYTVPAGAAWNTNTVYIAIQVTDGGNAPVGGNVFVDNFSIQTYPSNQAFVSVGLDFQNLANVAKPSTNNWIIGCRVTVNYEAAQCAMGAFQFTHNGSSNPGIDIPVNGAKLWWTGGTNTFSLTNAIQVGTYFGGFPVANFNITPTIPAPYNGLLNGNNYFWLTYDITAGAIANDYVDADFISANICATLQTCGGVGCALTGACLIDVAYCVPTYTAGTSWLNGSYTNNDYVKWFRCAGDPAYPPGINNDHNDQGPNLGGSNNHVCGACSGGNCPFSVHPPDYQKFGTAASPFFCPQSTGTVGRTAVFLVSNAPVPTYTFQVRCGTWFGANYIAAFIDMNHDGVFNNTMSSTVGGEKLFQSGSMNALAYYPAVFGSVTFALPAAAGQFYGQTTLRVREWYAQPNIDACSPGYYGETEDYTVTLRPDCSPLWPGWKIWLGYTDDWNVNSNWCGGVPTINDHALIPGKGALAYNRGNNTYHPVIKSGVLATTKKL